MNENNELADQNNFAEPIAKLHEHYVNVMEAVATQDIEKCEENLRFAQSIYKNIEINFTQDVNVYFCNLVNLMETATRFLRATLFFDDERLNKSLEEYNATIEICGDAEKNFSLLSEEAEKLLNREGSVSMLRFMFTYFENTSIVMHELVKKNLDMRKGKFVNQVEMLRETAAGLKKEDYLEYFGENEEINKVVSALVKMLNARAGSYEKKAERLEEKMEDIEFMMPIDKKVFIVHGHNANALDELKNLLSDELKIAPIVLWKERNEGKTIIEKFEHYGRICAFAFVLVTPDDTVTVDGATYFQARPNVLFELGWFCGRYGRAKVRILNQKKTPLPSDLNGLETYEFDEKISEISENIKADLITAGILDDTRQIETV